MRHLKAVFLLITLATGALTPGLAYAHDGSGGAARGLSAVGQSLTGFQSVAGPSTILSGWFHIIYGDAPPGSSVRTTSGYVLIDAAGGSTELVVDEAVLASVGGPRAINHEWVTVLGQLAAPSFALGGTAPLNVVQVQAIQPLGAAAPVSAAPAPAVSGSQPWATILCRFADSTGVTPNPVSYFQSLMLPGSPSVAPGLDHYWRELSFNNVNLTGSAVVGWYNLPQPRSYYLPGGSLDFQRAANDCTAVADAAVFFPSFVGINLMFNDNLDGFAWGGSWTLTRDGVTKTYRMTWVPPWGYQNQGPIAHEMGHGFGLPHSSGPYTAPYDSRWDVMSDIWDNCPPYDPTYGCVGPHTISYHKDILGWIPGAQKYVAAVGTSQTIMMERLGQPTTSNYLMAQLPIGGSASQFYTVEVRRFAGYDTKLPGQAVVIHRVDTTRSDRDAQVVDIDGCCNPNDAAAMWLPGETFVDSVNQFTVAVNAQVGNGFQVTITNGTVVSYNLSVTVSGTGTVTSNPAGINCSSGTCVANFTSGTSVTLAVTSGTLTAWGGDCSGTGSCVVSMTQNRSVTATFTTSATATSLTANVSFPVPAGTQVTWTATATGGTAPLQYRFWRFDVATNTWTMVRDYTTSNTFLWATGSADVGQHKFGVWVRSAGSPAAYESYLGTAVFTITAATATATSLTANVTFPVPAGTQVTWTATATGGTAPLQYRFWRFDVATGIWTMVRDYTTSNTFLWATGSADVGQHKFGVWVRSAGSPAAYESYLGTSVFTIQP